MSRSQDIQIIVFFAKSTDLEICDVITDIAT